MRRSFTLKTKAYSINAAYCRDRAYKNRDCRDWEENFLFLLSDKNVQTPLAEIRAAFNPDAHSYAIRMVFVYPEETYFNMKDRVSSKTFDLSNVEKLCLDLLFDEKHCGGIHGKEFTNLATNDVHVTQLSSFKRPGQEFAIRFDIKLVNKPVRQSARPSQPAPAA